MALQVMAPQSGGIGAGIRTPKFSMSTPEFRNFGEAPKIVNAVGEATDGFMKSFFAYQQKKQKMRDEEDLSAALSDLQKQAVEFQSNWKGTHFGTEARDAGKIFSQHVDETAIKMIDERFKGRDELAARFRSQAAQVSFSGFSHGMQYDDQQDLQYRKSALEGQRNDLSALIATGSIDDINCGLENYKAARGVFFPGMDFSEDDHKLDKMVHAGMIERSILDGNMQGARAHLKAGLEAGVFSIDEFSRLTSHIDQGVIDQISIAGASGDAHAVRRVAAENGFKGGSVSVSGDFSTGIARETTGFSGKTKYGFGSRDPNSGRVDCSGWVGHLMESAGLKGFKGKTADQLVVHAQKVGRSVSEEELFSSPSEGLVIGIDQGPRSYDKGRVNGIDHVVLTYKDSATGRIMVSESSSSKGVHSMPLDDWLSYHKRQGHKFFAGQVGSGDANPDRPMNPHQVKVKSAADAQLKKIEANITEGSEEALKLGKYGNLSALRGIESNLRKQGFTEKANAYADQIRILESTENARRWAAVATIPELRARQRSTAARVRDPFDFTDRYNTELTPDEEREFREWQKKNPRLGNTYDYDARGYWKELKAGTMKHAEGDDAHAGDKYKKPNHPTFSDQSIYHGADGFNGGHWEQRPDGSWIYTATESNTYGADRLGAYFSDVEKGNTLVPHPNQGRAAGKTLAEYQKIDAEAKALEEVLKSRQAAYDKDPVAAALDDLSLMGSQNMTPVEMAREILSIQQRNGIPEGKRRIFTKDQAESFKSSWKHASPMEKVTLLTGRDGLVSQYGKYASKVLSELGISAHDTFIANAVALDPSRENDARVIWDIMQKEMKNVPDAVTEENVNIAYKGLLEEDMFKVLGLQIEKTGSSEAYELALSMQHTAKKLLKSGMDQRDVISLLSFGMDTVFDSDRAAFVPKGMTADNLDKAIDALRRQKVEAAVNSEFTGSRRSDEADRILKQGVWINAPDMDGLLLVNGITQRPEKNPDGSYVRISSREISGVDVEQIRKDSFVSAGR